MGNQTMEYYVWPRYIYSHSRTCTHSSSCRIPSSLVEFHICYLLDRASVHDILALMIWFQCIPDFFSHYGDLDLLYIFIHFGYSDLLYIVRGDDHTFHILYIMPIHGHCTLMYRGLLYVFTVLCRDWLLYCINEWLVLPLGSSLLHFWDGLYNVFQPSCYPFELTH